MKKSFILQQQEISFVKNTFTQYLIDKLGIIEVQGPILSEVGNGMQEQPFRYRKSSKSKRKMYSKRYL